MLPLIAITYKLFSIKIRVESKTFKTNLALKVSLEFCGFCWFFFEKRAQSSLHKAFEDPRVLHRLAVLGKHADDIRPDAFDAFQLIFVGTEDTPNRAEVVQEKFGRVAPDRWDAETHQHLQSTALVATPLD